MTVVQFGAIAGPLVGGALIPLLGYSVLYLTDTLSMFATLWAVFELPALPPEGLRHRRLGCGDGRPRHRGGSGRGSMGIMLAAALGALVIGGAADMASAAFRNTMLQEAASDEVRGRLQGVFTVVVSGGPRLADVAHGTAGGLA